MNNNDNAQQKYANLQTNDFFDRKYIIISTNATQCYGYKDINKCAKSLYIYERLMHFNLDVCINN